MTNSVSSIFTPNSVNGLFHFVLLLSLYSYVTSYIYLQTFILFFIFVCFIRFVFILSDCDLILFFCDKYGKSVDDLNGNVIWITGASTGIGEGLALELSKGRTKLALSARTEEKLQSVKKRCIENGKLSEDDILVVPFDMTDYSKHEWAFSTILDHFGRLDVLVSNAGRSQRAYWENIDVAVDRVLFELNVFSLMNLARIATKHFLSVGHGKHVVISSVAGLVGTAFSASYTGSKHALIGYFETLRAEKGAHGISINIICPGPVESNLDASILYEKLEEKTETRRKGKMMSTKRCAELCVSTMANDVKLAWIAEQPILTLLYVNQYLPWLGKWIAHKYDISKSMIKARDGNEKCK